MFKCDGEVEHGGNGSATSLARLNSRARSRFSAAPRFFNAEQVSEMLELSAREAARRIGSSPSSRCNSARGLGHGA